MNLDPSIRTQWIRVILGEDGSFVSLDDFTKLIV